MSGHNFNNQTTGRIQLADRLQLLKFLDVYLGLVKMSIQTEQSPSHSSVLHASLAASPPNIVSASGNYLYTKDGISLFDASGGAAVSCIG